MDYQFSRRTAILVLWDIVAAFLTGLLVEITTVDFMPHEIYFMAGANAIVYTPPSSGELFRSLMDSYREA